MTQQPDLSMAEDIVCERCGNYTFQDVFLFKKVSALLSPTGKTGLVPIQTFACVACGNVNSMFMADTGAIATSPSDPAQLSLDL
jgi:hypothetical protein